MAHLRDEMNFEFMWLPSVAATSLAYAERVQVGRGARRGQQDTSVRRARRDLDADGIGTC